MRRLFRSFERFDVEYLLISGQASILYGAAMFSEDIDLWLRPSTANVRGFLSALATCRARIHKLTPPMTVRNLLAGHGFHFIVPATPLPTYLDIMGQPPRVGSFSEALRHSRTMKTDWGRVPVVAIPELIALKRTRRLNDYEVISNLVRVRLSEVERPGRKLLQWSAANSFRAEDRAEYLNRLGRPASVDQCRTQVALELVKHQKRDVRYWHRHLVELRRWRRDGTLWPEGITVAQILAGMRR